MSSGELAVEGTHFAARSHSLDLVCCGFSTPLAPCFPAGDRRVRGPAGEICIVRTRTVGLFTSFCVTSSNIPLENPFDLGAASSSSFFSIIAADFVFPQIADFVANCALWPRGRLEDSPLKIVSVRHIPFPDDSI